MFIALSCLHRSPPTSQSPSLFLPDRSDIRNLYYQVFPGCWWKSWFATPDWIYLSFIPFQPPASCPSRQEPNGLSILRCQGIKISIYRKRGRERERREWGEKRRGKTKRGAQRVSAHMSQLWTAWWWRWWWGGEGCKCSPWLFPSPTPAASPFAKTFIYLHYTSIYQSANKTRHAPPSWIPPAHATHAHTHTDPHPQANLSDKVKLVKSLKGGERSKGHRGNSLNDCNLR